MLVTASVTCTPYLTLFIQPESENFFVHIPVSESDFVTERDKLPDLYIEDIKEKKDTDLLIYFAIALVALLFAEWLLQMKENF